MVASDNSNLNTLTSQLSTVQANAIAATNALIGLNAILVSEETYTAIVQSMQ